MVDLGFDTEKYLQAQSNHILRLVENYDKLYLEFGGKLIGDKHAKRVLPGFEEDAKMKLLNTLRDKAEIIICVYAKDIENNRMRGDYGITYDLEVLRLIDEYRERGITVNSVLLTRYKEEPSAKSFKQNLKNRGIDVYVHREIDGYPTDIEAILGSQGFAKNEFIPTSQPIVVVTSPGANSGKLATCLNQLYHEHQGKTKAGYAKFETFPVWNLPLKHPVNIAYEAATVDIKDVNMIDNYHYEAYGEVAVNYNRDLQLFPVIKKIMENITGGESAYASPTDMGVNQIATGILDDQIIAESARQEIIRRSFQVETDYKKGLIQEDIVSRMHLIMEEAGLTEEDRHVVVKARQYQKELQKRFKTQDQQAAIAIELPTKEVVTGRTGSLLDSSAAAIVNSLKTLAGIADSIDLLAPNILETIQDLKRIELKSKTPTLTANELLIALAISAVTNPMAKVAYDQLEALDSAQVHSTVFLSDDNLHTLKRLGMDVTTDPVYATDQLFYQ